MRLIRQSPSAAWDRRRVGLGDSVGIAVVGYFVPRSGDELLPDGPRVGGVSAEVIRIRPLIPELVAIPCGVIAGLDRLPLCRTATTPS